MAFEEFKTRVEASSELREVKGIWVNMGEGELWEVANDLWCRVETLPIQYLDMWVGGRAKGVERWKDVVERVKKRLRGWDPPSYSIGGRVTIERSIIMVMPIYGMSLLPSPKVAANPLSSLQCMFLWGR